jgi:hypothetical protein
LIGSCAKPSRIRSARNSWRRQRAQHDAARLVLVLEHDGF